MKAIMIDYYYQFLHERHYFECHELLEDAWKAQPLFTKQDIEVAFIMLATSQYHQRRGNISGAARCLTKAIDGFIRHHSQLNDYGVETTIIPLLKQRFNQIHEPYLPLQLPLTSQCLNQLTMTYPGFNSFNEANREWIDFHRTRDRSDIIAARTKRLMSNKDPVDDPPQKCGDQQCD